MADSIKSSSSGLVFQLHPVSYSPRLTLIKYVAQSGMPGALDAIFVAY